MCQQDQPWISMIQYFIEHSEGLVNGITKFQASWLPLLSGCIPLKIQQFVYAQQMVRSWQDAFIVLSGHHQVIKSFVFHYKMNFSFLLNCCIGIESRS